MRFLIPFLFLTITIHHAKSQDLKSTDPEISIMGKTGDTIVLSRAELLEWKSIRTTFKEVVVVEFQISASSNGALTELKALGNKLTKEMREYLARNNDLRKFYIEAIKVKMLDHTIRTFPPIAVQIAR